MRYAIWNNKGGVGKSFLTFILASEYASQNSDKNVYVIDMCPQANVSEMFLGGNGKGAKEFEKLVNARDPRQTIGGYFDSRVAQPHSMTGRERSFAFQPSKVNTHVPANLRLVAGDPSLEVQAEAINQIANQSLPQDTWRNVHSWLADLCNAIEANNPNSTFFIDCNPSFAAYTELAIVAANQLIVPCSADGSSARALDNIGQLVYGREVPERYRGAMFASRLKNEGLAPPRIKMVILNRSTQYNQKASKAFGAMFEEIKTRAETLLAEPEVCGCDSDCFLEIPDTHSVAIVSSHHGMPIRSISVGRYQVYDETPQVNEPPLQRYRQAISDAVTRL